MKTTKGFSHFDATGNARMVDVGGKADTCREALAGGTVAMSEGVYRLVKDGGTAKGDVLGVARIAGIMAAKKVDSLIPLTHTLSLNKVVVDFVFNDADHAVHIEATAAAVGRTGVEMEALTAVAVAALTIYDMCKALDKGIVIGNIRLLRKSGGKGGKYCRGLELL